MRWLLEDPWLLFTVLVTAGVCVLALLLVLSVCQAWQENRAWRAKQEDWARRRAKIMTDLERAKSFREVDGHD